MKRAIVLGAIALLLIGTYSVRETLVAEFLFMLAFLVVFCVGFLCYGIGSLVEIFWSYYKKGV